MKFISKTGAKALLIAVCGMSVTIAMQAANYTWRGTNSTAWTTPGNWLNQNVGPTGAAGIGHRLDVNNAAFNGLVYDASLGTTIYGTNGVRGLTIGNSSLGFGTGGTMTISGGTFITTNGSAGDLIGNGDNTTGILNINGGTFVSGAANLALGIATGVNRTATLNVNSGSATAGSVTINTLRGTINLNGGVFACSNILVTSAAGVNATNNFNGGTMQARASTTGFFPTAPLAVSVANVRDGGAIIDTAGFNISMAQPLIHSTISGDAAIDGGLTKNGNGTLTLSGVPTYTGPTRVNAGRLTTPLPTTSSSLVLAAGARFTPALTNFAWLVGSAALTNATVDFNYGSFYANPNANASLYLTNLAISGSVTCNIAGTGFPITNITLLSYGSKTGGGSFVLGSLPSGAVATLNDDGANVTLNITAASIQNLIWSGGDGIWQTNGGLDWNSGTATYLEYPSGMNDTVTFDDTSSGSVNINSQVKPSGTTVSIPTSFYTFSGSGSIGGTNGIVFSGGGTLTINNSNNFTGPVSLIGGSSGSLYVGNSFALGATNGGVTVSGPVNTVLIGTVGGAGVTVSNKTVTINGTGIGGSKGALRGAPVSSGNNIWAGPVIIGSDFSRIGADDSGGNLTVSGNITDNGLGYSIFFRPGTSASVTVAGTGNSWSGLTAVFGSASGGSVVKLGANNAIPGNSGLAIGTCTFDLNGFNQTSPSLSLYLGGAAASTILTDSGAAATFTVNATNADSSFPGDVTGNLSLMKSGSNTLTLTGANLTYTGTTTVGQGKLNLWSPSPMSSSITVNGGATLSMTNTTSGSLTLNANSILSLAAGIPLTVGSLNASAAPLNISLAVVPAPASDTLLVNATGGITGGAANFQVLGARGGTFYFANGNTELHYVAPATTSTVTWKGNDPINPTLWDVATTTNWSKAGSPDKFYFGDFVVFDDSASTNTVVIQTGGVVPGGVTFSNSALSYTVSGASFGGNTLTKTGSGQVTLAAANSYSGATIVNNGILTVQNSSALGSAAAGAFVTNSGTLDLGGALAANQLNLSTKVITIAGNGFGGNGTVINSSANNQINALQQLILASNAAIGGPGATVVSGALSSTGAGRWDLRGTGNTLDMAGFNLTKTGSNFVALVSTTVNNPGNIVINGGALGIQTATTLGGSSANTLTVNSNSVLELFSTANNPVWSLVLNAGSSVWAENGSGVQNNLAGPVALNGAATLQADAVLTISGAITGSGSLTKTGTGTASLTASNSYSGNTTVNAGTLIVDYPSFASGSTITVSNSAVLNLNFIGTNTVAALVLNGVSQPAGVYDATSGAPYITGTGALQVVPASAPTMTFTNSGSSLQITFTGGTLQAQTNALSSGLGTNWVNYPGSSPVTVPIDPANGSVFFRVKQ